MKKEEEENDDGGDYNAFCKIFGVQAQGGATGDGGGVVIVFFELCFKYVQKSMERLNFAQFCVVFGRILAEYAFKKRRLGRPWGGGWKTHGPQAEFIAGSCNIPNFQFGMLYIKSLCISYFRAFADPRNFTQLKDPGESWRFCSFSYLSFLKL